MESHGASKLKTILLLSILLILSAYTHLLNLTGFPRIYVDEGHYLSKAISTTEGKGLQPQNRYYAPYFGQMFLAGVFKLINYPSFLIHSNPVPDSPNSIADLYLVPRLIVGILGIIDTLLIFKITEKRYCQAMAFSAAILFAVMPFSWMTRRVLLETIQLPFMLTSILLILNIDIQRAVKLQIIISGLFMGLAIFTKIPAFTFIPLAVFIIYSKSRNLKYVGLWLIPAILIPALWPIHATVTGDLNDWISGVIYQTNRSAKPLIFALYDFFVIDPVLLVLGIAGLVFAAIKKDIFLLLLSVPTVVFFYLIGYVASFHLILLLPSLCIAAGYLLTAMGQIIMRKIKMKEKEEKVKVGPFIPAVAVSVFGIIITGQLISLDMNSNYYDTLSFVLGRLPGNILSDISATNNGSITISNDEYNNNDRLTLVSSAEYFWIPELVFNKTLYAHSYYSHNNLKSDRFIVIADDGFFSILNSANLTQAPKLSAAFNSTHSLAKFDRKALDQILLDRYPYNSLNLEPLSKIIDIRANY